MSAWQHPLTIRGTGTEQDVKKDGWRGITGVCGRW